jgi:hypothetical protein
MVRHRLSEAYRSKKPEVRYVLRHNSPKLRKNLQFQKFNPNIGLISETYLNLRFQKYNWNFGFFCRTSVIFIFSENIHTEVQENDMNFMEISRNSVKISITDCFVIVNPKFIFTVWLRPVEEDLYMSVCLEHSASNV